MDDVKLEKIFTGSVIVLVLLNYINMGCAVNLQVVKSVLRKPVAPAIGFIAQYLFMPVISYFAGLILLSQDAFYYWFGLFAFGCSPGGSASNMWTLVLGGNLDLSLTMTFLSTFSALFMIPIWLFSLGHTIVGSDSSFIVPYGRITGMLFAMAFFLGIGLAFQHFLPNVAKKCKKILAPASTLMIIFIVIFSTYVYWSLVKKLTLRIMIAAALNVWFGFTIGFVMSYLFKFSKGDRIAIMVETGVQNTGISIMLIRLALESPESDMATLLPVAASLMTPIPLTIFWIARKIIGCEESLNITKSDPSKMMNCSDSSSCKIISIDSKSGLINGHTTDLGDTNHTTRSANGLVSYYNTNHHQIQQ